MKTTLTVLLLLMFLGLGGVLYAQTGSQTGEELFRKNCSPCHPDGGNILNRQKTLFKKDREANGITSAADIIRKMRNPGAFDFHPNKWSGMKIFSEKKLSDTDARKIADYIIKTFN